MKWREPWLGTLRRQEPLNLFTRSNGWSASILTVAFLVIWGLGAFASEAPILEVASRAWIAPVAGVLLAALLSSLHWLSPLGVSSGPRGIVRSKGEALALIPWDAIQAYRFYPSGDECVLELRVSYTSELELFYIPSRVDISAVEEELRQHVRAKV